MSEPSSDRMEAELASEDKYTGIIYRIKRKVSVFFLKFNFSLADDTPIEQFLSQILRPPDFTEESIQNATKSLLQQDIRTVRSLRDNLPDIHVCVTRGVASKIRKVLGKFCSLSFDSSVVDWL